MISVILCEGADDAHFLGYYVHKVSSKPRWFYNTKAKFTELYNLPKKRNSEPQIYVRENSNDRLAIWPSGGKDSYKRCINHIVEINKNYPQFSINNIFIVSDKDKDDVESTVKIYEEYFRENEYISNLKNNQVNECIYKVDDEEFKINIIPIVIPFNEDGALETVLLNQIASMNEENNIIVNSAKEYVQQIVENKNIGSYLKMERLRLKSVFSSAIAIINPDHSTRVLNDLLMSFEWQNEREIKEHFGIIEKILK